MEIPKLERTPQAADKYVLRMPDGMREKINELAKANGRSMNAEMILMLQQALEARAQPPALGIDTHTLAAEIADLVAAKLRASQ